MLKISMIVNGETRHVETEPRTLLVDLLRDHLRLTGTHIGCDTSQCGACTIHLDGEAVKSCTTLAAQAEGSNITTIEGLAAEDDLHPMQRAFQACHGLQCGYCTPGMIMMAVDIVRRCGNHLDGPTVRRELDGNICRCTGYHNIVRAVLTAAKEMRAHDTTGAASSQP